MIQILPKERWPEIEGILAREFSTQLPGPMATILADVGEDGEIKGFMVCEFLAQIDQIYQTGKSSRMMFEFFNNQIPPGSSVIAMADTPRFERLCQRFGMRKESGVVYRKDF